MFGINQITQPVVHNPNADVCKIPCRLDGVSAGVSVSTGLLTLVVIGGIAYFVFKK